LFIDCRTIATRPAFVPVIWSAYCRAYPTAPLTFAVLLALAIVFRHDGVFALTSALIGAFGSLAYRSYTKKRFDRGNLCAGQIVNPKPFLVAVLTDLANDGESSYPVIKIFSPPKPKQPMSIGTRVAAVSLYSGVTPAGHWGDCFPELAISANPDSALHDELLARFTDEEWHQLKEACERLPKPFKRGLYPLALEGLVKAEIVTPLARR
jgi:hypothetical protein